MIGAGTIINPIIKIVTTVAILGACYLFFVKPALDTTENISDSINKSVSGSSQAIREDVQDSINQSLGATPNVDVQIPQAAKQAQKLGACITAAAPDVEKINRCTAKFSP